MEFSNGEFSYSECIFLRKKEKHNVSAIQEMLIVVSICFGGICLEVCTVVTVSSQAFPHHAKKPLVLNSCKLR